MEDSDFIPGTNVLRPEVVTASKEDQTNPKDRLGIKKISLAEVSPIAIVHEAAAMMDGALKYGTRNWRDKKVRANVYINACKRHLDLWAEGQEYTTDTNVHNLGAARACLGILLDALETGCLLDDRVKSNYPEVQDRLNEWARQRVEKQNENRS